MGGCRHLRFQESQVHMETVVARGHLTFVTVPSTRIRLTLRVWGPNLNPARLTESTGVEPHRTFQVGELRGAAANPVAGWEWRSSEGDDDAPLIARMIEDLGGRADALRACHDDGAKVWLTTSGSVRGDLVETAVEAERRRWHVDKEEAFRPFLDVDRVGLSLSIEAVRFLGAIGASFHTHIDAEFEPNEF